MTRPSTLRKWTHAIGALALAGALGGVGACGSQPHLREDHGVQSRTFFDRQAEAAKDGTGQGLDSEEASLIHESYRETLGQKVRRRDQSNSSMLMLENGNGTKIKR